MAKNKRKRKLKEQDFQKVKLKVGKKLQPAQNATDTSFKSRSIFIPKQLQKLDSEPTNQRNQTLKDLLSQVGHYSVTTRQEALAGLKDLFQLHENLLQENLGIIIKRVAEKMTDSDPSVRQSLLLLLCFIFPLVPQERMAPFSPLVIAHLSCAMTHIYDDIQHDSLGFLELCLRYFPNLMVTSSSQLIQNFLSMISHQSTSGTKKSKGSQPKAGKGLSVNPKGKLSSLRSRLKVLQQLLAFLKALESSRNPCQGESLLSSMNHADFSSRKPVFNFQKHLPTQVQVLQHSVDEPILLPFTFDNTSMAGVLSANTGSNSNILTDRQQANDFMEMVVPLLLECWIECNPAQMTTGLPDSVTPSSIEVMLAITEILKVIFKAAQRNPTQHPGIFEQGKDENYLHGTFKDINQHFMSYFPFTASHTPLKKGKRKTGKSSQQAAGEKTSASVLALNLAICEIMIQFVRNNFEAMRKYQASVQKLEEFVLESLELKAKGGAQAQQFQTEHVESLVKFAHQLVLYVNQDSDMTRELLSATYNLYQSSHVTSGTKRALMVFFSSLVFPENPNVPRQKEVHGLVEKWLQGLPGVLVQLKDDSPGMTELVLKDMKKALVQCVLQPDANFLAHLSLFFSKDSGSFIKLSEAIQRSAVELLFHLPSLNDQLLQNVVSCCHGGQLGVSVIQYILQVLYYRSPCYQGFVSNPAALSLETYLSVLLSVAIGFSKTQLSEYQDKSKQAETHELTGFIDCSFCILEQDTQVNITLRSEWQAHQMTLQAACQCYRQCPQSDFLSQHVGQGLETFLHDFKVLPVTAVHSFLCVVKCVVELASPSDSADSSHSLPANLMLDLVQLTLVCLQHCTSMASTSGALESNKDDVTSSTASVVKKHLFDAVVELLVAVPEVIIEMLPLLLKIVSDSSESVKQNCAAILTKLLGSDVRKILLQSTDTVQLLVPRILSSENPGSQCFADLQYQYSLFKVEAGLT
ncbi:testis-expressed protein 10-like isoform X2 [Oculina patagonica]